MKTYIIPAIKVKEVKSVILAGSPEPKLDPTSKTPTMDSKDNFINFVGYEESEE